MQSDPGRVHVLTLIYIPDGLYLPPFCCACRFFFFDAYYPFSPSTLGSKKAHRPYQFRLWDWLRYPSLYRGILPGQCLSAQRFQCVVHAFLALTHASHDV
jgi:hypothetical protein